MEDIQPVQVIYPYPKEPIAQQIGKANKKRNIQLQSQIEAHDTELGATLDKSTLNSFHCLNF